MVALLVAYWYWPLIISILIWIIYKWPEVIVDVLQVIFQVVILGGVSVLSAFMGGESGGGGSDSDF